MDLIFDEIKQLPKDLRKYIIYEYALPHKDIPVYYECVICKFRFYLTGLPTYRVPYRNLDDIIEQTDDITGEKFYYCECKKCRNKTHMLMGKEHKERQQNRIKRRIKINRRNKISSNNI